MSRGTAAGPPVKVGIVGFGSQGRRHFDELWNVAPFEVAWVFDESARLLAAVGETLRARSLADALGRDARLVVVATPPSTHFDIARALLRAGKHVVIEKPTAVTDSETRRLLETARRRNLLLLTHFSRRWDADFLTVKRALESADFGRLHEIESRVTDAYDLSGTYPGRKAWKFRHPGGGILLDWAPHLFDQLFELMAGQRPQHVYCQSARPNRVVHPKLEEQFVIQVKYPDCLATLGASWNAGLPRRRWLVYGTRAALSVDEPGARAGTLSLRRGQSVLTRRVSVTRPPSPADAFRELVLASVRGRKRRAEEAERIRMVSYAIELSRRSHLKGKPLKWGLWRERKD